MWLVGAIVLSFGLHLMIMHVEPMPMIFNICSLNVAEWKMVMKLSLPVILIGKTIDHKRVDHLRVEPSPKKSVKP